jgi:hypothetical protein
LLAVFIATVAVVYKQFGGVIYDALAEDGKRMLAEHNAAEDAVIESLVKSIEEVEQQLQIVQDYQDVKALKVQSYEQLNAAGQIKPQYEFKQQVERLLVLMAQEETYMLEKGKHTLMEQATEAVKKQFLTQKNLKKNALDAAIAQLKGSKSAGGDPVKQAYLKFFQESGAAAKKVDAAAEIKETRAAVIAKLNTVAKNEGFFFEFDAEGKPKLVA